jgi:hypothetical protein
VITLRTVFCLVFVTALAGAQSVPVSLAPDQWTLSQRNFKFQQAQDLSHNGEVGEYQGRNSLRVSKGLFFARDTEFLDGTIEFDVAPSANAAFAGVAFRVQSDDEYELIFFRPRASRKDQGIQYTPVFGGAPAWQIYNGPGYTGPAAVPLEKWTHVRLVLSGSLAKLYLGDAAEPTLTVSDLRRAPQAGKIGFWGHAGDAYYSNLTYTPAQPASVAEKPHDFAPGTLADWSLSDAFEVSEKDPAKYPDVRQMKWEKVQAEDPGMVLINRYRRSPNVLPPDSSARIRGDMTGAKVVFAKTIIHSDREQLRRLNLAYSDEVVAYLNGRPLFQGINDYSFREPGYYGTLSPDGEAVYLPLKKGDNELVLAVSEFFGGWAFLCRLGP